VIFIAWYFSSILISILIAAVLALIGKPIMTFLSSIKIGKYKINIHISALITLSFLVGIIFLFFFFFFPLAGKLVREMSTIDLDLISQKLSEPLANWNIALHKFAPTLSPNVTIESMVMDQLKSIFSVDLFTNVFSSFTSFIVQFCIYAFTVIFVTFFFLQDNSTFTRMILVLVPDKYEQHTRNALKSIKELLIRYFTGISIETIFITILNTIGLHFICGLDLSLAIILALISGIMNVIPYIGPLFSGAFGTLMGIITLYGEFNDIVFSTLIIKFVLTFVITHLIDVFVFQPYIYSNSVKAHPLEIFLVILVGGNIGGVIGMLIAIPTYTVIRVIAKEFFSEISIVKKLW
jgi:Predicted permease